MANLFQTLRELWGPWYIKVSGTLLGALGTYDLCCNQFGWPKIPEVWGVTGSLLPWWGWLLILQSVFTLALFEYVRRTITKQPILVNDTQQPANQDALEAKVTNLEKDMRATIKRISTAEGVLQQQEATIQRVERELQQAIGQETIARMAEANGMADRFGLIENQHQSLSDRVAATELYPDAIRVAVSAILDAVEWRMVTEEMRPLILEINKMFNSAIPGEPLPPPIALINNVVEYAEKLKHYYSKVARFPINPMTEEYYSMTRVCTSGISNAQDPMWQKFAYAHYIFIFHEYAESRRDFTLTTLNPEP